MRSLICHSAFMLHQVRGFDKLEHAASNVSEIDKVEGKEITEFHLEGEAEQTAQASEETKKADKEEKRKDSCCKDRIFKAKNCK